jgi:hypothetical protein
MDPRLSSDRENSDKEGTQSTPVDALSVSKQATMMVPTARHLPSHEQIAASIPANHLSSRVIC